MSNNPISMQKLRQIMRLYCQGTGIKTIHGMIGTSRNTIKKYVRIFHELDMTYEEFSAKSDGDLCELFSAAPSRVTDNRRKDELEAMLPSLAKKLSKKGVTRDMFHKE